MELLKERIKNLFHDHIKHAAHEVIGQLREEQRANRVERDRWKGKKTTQPSLRPRKKSVPKHLKTLVARL